MDFQKQQPIYLQIGDYILENILKKNWSEGERIPSVRELAVNIEVNPNTVMRTYSYLQDIGVIFNKRGIGYYVADNAYTSSKNMKRELFIQDDLPLVFKTMDLVDLTLNDLEPYYGDFKQQN